jgi:hypothetical protein
MAVAGPGRAYFRWLRGQAEAPERPGVHDEAFAVPAAGWGDADVVRQVRVQLAQSRGVNAPA